jgi:hypothetical protein
MSDMRSMKISDYNYSFLSNYGMAGLLIHAMSTAAFIHWVNYILLGSGAPAWFLLN